MMPSSCGGPTNEFNLFPYRVKSHNAYNKLFLNMDIWQVWEALILIHEEIFFTDDEKIGRSWLKVCRFRNEDDKIREIEKEVGVLDLQEDWITAFGGESLQRAQRFLKYMMLFMIFGHYMADTDYLFDNGNLTEFFEEYPADAERLRAFEVCFGRSADWQRIKSRMSKLLNQLNLQ